MLSGTVVYDLTDAKPDRMRARVGSLPDVPAGARVILRVGALAPEPAVIRAVADHESRLHVDIHGSAHAVRRWLDALRTHNDGEVLL